MRRSLILFLILCVSVLTFGCASELIASRSNPDQEEGADTTGDTDGGDSSSSGGADVSMGDQSVAPFCGDGVVHSELGERCDDGANNSDTTPDACRTDCSEARCGDEVIDSNENCDNGAENVDDVPRACPTTCMSSGPVCGDGVVDDGEECDNGSDNSNLDSNACRRDCSEAGCGDGVVDDGEECDDGDGVDFNSCGNECVPVIADLCTSCQSDSDCGRGVDRCVDLGGAFCAVACDPSGAISCPNGYSCSSDRGDYLCLPDTGACVEICDSGLDDDSDGYTDCADPDCDSKDYCGPEVCDDGFDNDGDTLTDCDDAENCATALACQDPCAGPAVCVNPPTNESCQDDDVLLTYPGQCSNNNGFPDCAYPEVPVSCGATNLVCYFGECVIPCEATTCDQLPASSCLDINTRATYEATCANVAGTAQCEYPAATEDCSLSGQICLSGQCLFPAAVPRPTTPGDMIFTEVMINPNHTDQSYEWMELYNTTGDPFNLQDCLVTRSSAQFPISVTSGSFIALANEYVTLSQTDLASFEPGFLYGGSSFLIGGPSNNGDTLTLKCNGITIDTFTFSASAAAVEGFTFSLSPLSLDHNANDLESNWCISGAGSYHSDSNGAEFGSPGSVNPACP